jgi:hypothetical protein
VPLNLAAVCRTDAIQRASELTGVDDLLVLVDRPRGPHASAPHALMQAVKSNVAEGRPWVAVGSAAGQTLAARQSGRPTPELGDARVND